MMASIGAIPMLTWSSPFPSDPIPGLESVAFPGPKGSLLVFESPDQVLQHWKSRGDCDGAELERLEHGYETLVQLKQEKNHTVRARWQISQDKHPAPIPDGIAAALLMLLLQANPNALSSYLKLDPDYLQRLLFAQSQPRHLLHQWLTEPFISLHGDSPLREQYRQTREKLEELQRSQSAMKDLMKQVTDQQRRTRQLFATKLHKHQTPDIAD